MRHRLLEGRISGDAIVLRQLSVSLTDTFLTLTLRLCIRAPPRRASPQQTTVVREQFVHGPISTRISGRGHE